MNVCMYICMHVYVCAYIHGIVNIPLTVCEISGTHHSLVPSERRQRIAPPLPVNLALNPKLPASSTMLMLRGPTTASPTII